MSVCAICLDVLRAPVALPCGHVYCHGCISEAAKATASTSMVTHCPTCREPVPTVAPNPLFVPQHLRAYIQPPFRRLYLDESAPSTMPTDADPASISTAVEEADKIGARLHMENAVLRQCCHAWRARANAHVAAHIRLSAFVRLARDQARTLKGERDELARKYDALKRKFSDVDDREPEPEPESDSEEQQSRYVWDEPGARAQGESEAEAGTPASPDDVPCVPLVRPVADVPAVSRPGPQGNAKRRRISPVSLYSAVPAKSTTSIPAMVIPHVAPHQSAISARSTVFDN